MSAKANAIPGGSMMPLDRMKNGEQIINGDIAIRPPRQKLKNADLYGEGLLGESLAPERKGGALAERFMIPPFTVMSAREGWWQDRKRAWMALGIKSELGRGEDITWNVGDMDEYRNKEAAKTATALDEIKAAGPAVPVGFQPAAPVKQARQPSEPRAPAQPRTKQEPYRPALPETSWVAPTELPSLKGVKHLGFDTETKDMDLNELGPGCRRPGNYLVGMSLALDHDGPRLYLPMRHEGGGNLDPDMVTRWAQSELNAFDGELYGANMGYDLDWMANEGVTFGKTKAFHDVQVAEPLIDEWRFKYALDVLSDEYLGEGKDSHLLNACGAAYGYTTEKQIKTNLWRFPASYVGAYAEADADRPQRIFEKQRPKLEAEGLLGVYEMERKLIPLLVRMRRRGVRVDVNAAEIARKELIKERDVLLAKLRHFAGPQAEFMSPDSFVKAIEARGLKYTLTPSTKKPSITSAWLKANSDDEMISAVQEGRKINTVINTFMDGHVFTHAINGRIHCTFNQLKGDDGGTIARFSAQDPNLQNLPSRDPVLGPIVRKIFIPEDGEKWQRDDYSQIEYRILAHFAVGEGAEDCRQAYINDPETDYHKLCASFCGIDPEDKVARGRVKGINFAKGYGAGADKLASLLGCSLQEAITFINMYEAKLPFAKHTYNMAMKWGNKQGFITTLSGRRQRFSMYEPANNYGKGKKPALSYEAALKAYGSRIVRANTYTALNRKLQGSAADIMKKAMVDADEAGVFDVIGAPLVTVHDELGDSIPQTPAGLEAGRELTRILERAYTLKVPVLVDSQQGASWGHCK